MHCCTLGWLYCYRLIKIVKKILHFRKSRNPDSYRENWACCGKYDDPFLSESGNQEKRIYWKLEKSKKDVPLWVSSHFLPDQEI